MGIWVAKIEHDIVAEWYMYKDREETRKKYTI